MSMVMAWAVPDYVIYTRIDSLTDAAQLDGRLADQIATLTTPNAMVHHVLEIVPGTPFPVTTLREASQMIPSASQVVTGWWVVIDQNALSRFLGTLVMSMRNMRVHTVTQFDDALTFLWTRDLRLHGCERPGRPPV